MRIGLLGTGPWAQRVHAPALADHPEVRFAGVWGRRREAAAALADAHGTAVFDTPEALFAAVDAVAIALPPDVQAPLAIRAAEAGRHLLLDKPVALAPEEAAELLAAAERAAVVGRVFFTLRHHPTIADWIAEQAATGGWFTAHARWLGAVFTSDSPYAASPWRRAKGALWDVGPHLLSVLLPALGEVERLTAVGGAADTVHLVLRHAGGATSSAELSLSAPPAAAEVSLELRGTAGVTRLPDFPAGPRVAFGRAIDELLAEAAGAGAGAGAAGAGTGSGGAGLPPCDLAFGLRVVRLLALAEESLRTGRTVVVAD
ncbi:Gfo/Idh/MocA family protein [Kitasatospora viridis]|uniref:Putative dehydrogenase n=1 Tax=Kitasatospora viridis TaxID=281105 RepID=A0A561T7F4_9ACTN|nr:Gfo/Idh/MocA family oxidoreductase [Kitasatospora viridis]TWF83032.1 putative dehydrogenase [Kitasatospora viridis]